MKKLSSYDSMPFNMVAEQKILAAIIQNPSFFTKINDEINPDDFFDISNKEIYKTIIDMDNHNIKIDSLSLHDRIKQLNKEAITKGYDYIDDLSNELISESQIDGFIALIKEASLKRAMILLNQELSKKSMVGSETASELIDYAETEIYRLSKKKSTNDFIRLKDVLEKFKKQTEEIKTRGTPITGLDVGYKKLNKYTAGFQPEELIILAARPGVGKSAFALNLAYRIAKQVSIPKKNIAFFSLEMSNEQLVQRLVALASSIDASKLKTAQLSKDDWANFNLTVAESKDLNIFFDDSGSTTISDVRAKCRKLKENSGLDFVIVDYLQLLKDENAKNKTTQEEISQISRGLKQLARELKIPVLALSQLSREVEKTDDKRPVLANLRGSGSIEQDADIVLFLHRDDAFIKNKKDENTISEAELIIAKNRQGMTGVVEFAFEKNIGRFTIREMIENEQ